jgi:solute carrier family 35 protein E1
MTRVQGAGFALTFLGLYLYDRTSDAAKAERRAKAALANKASHLLPVNSQDAEKRSAGAGSMNGGSKGAADHPWNHHGGHGHVVR